MSYKVSYYTLAIMNDGGYGNIKQETGHVFTDTEIKDIPEHLNKFLEPKKRIGVIEKIEDLKGKCI